MKKSFFLKGFFHFIEKWKENFVHFVLYQQWILIYFSRNKTCLFTVNKEKYFNLLENEFENVFPKFTEVLFKKKKSL